MIANLKPYPDYRDSGVPWLDEIPAHWDVLRAKYLFREVDERSSTGEEELLSVSHITGVTPRSQKKITMFKAESYVGHKICHANDLVINTMWAWMGALGVAKETGLVSPSYAVYRPSPSQGVHSEYLNYQLRTKHYVNEYVRRSTGIRSSRLRLYPEKFLDMPIILPSRREQETTIAYLRRHNHLMGRYIHAQRRLIALLEEQVAVRATEAMRHPAHRSERLGTIAVQQLRPVTRDSASQYTALGLFNRGRGLFHKAPVLGSDLGDSTFFWVDPGDLVISGQFAWEGAVALASSSEKNTVVSHRYYLLQGIEGRSTTPYLWALLRSDFGRMLLDQHSRGGAGRNRPLNLSRLLKERVPVPPLEEQWAIDELVRSMAPIRIDIKSKISLLEEYRTRLIADVVTGRLDVRQAVAHLPEEADEPEDWEADENQESDEGTGEAEVEADEED